MQLIGVVMNKKSLLALALASVVGAASASVIRVESASATSPILASANAYRDAVNAALLSGTYVSQMVASYNSLSHQSLFGGNSNYAFKATINFSAATAGVWDFRAGVDFGSGGALFLDGVAIDVQSNDMWWGGAYTNPSQYFSATSNLAAGNHVLTMYGFEGCCDGAQQFQYRTGNQGFTSFASNDGLNVVPEPASLALLLTGAGLVGFSGRRKQARAA